MPTSSGSIDFNSVLLHLPEKDLQEYLLSRLDLNSLKAARCANKLLQSRIDPFLKFHLELSDATKGYVQAFGTSRKVASVTTTALQGKYPTGGVNVRTEKLRVTVDILHGNGSFDDYRRRSRDDRLKRIGLTEYNFRRIVHDFQYVRKFHIASLAVRSFTNDAKKQLSRVYLPNVKEIIITFFDGGFHQLLPFMRNYFPKLENANIANVAVSRKNRPILYSWIFGFVGRHRQMLTELTLILPEGMVDERSFDSLIGAPIHGNGNRLPRMNVRQDLRRDLSVPPSIYRDIKNRLENLTSLKKLVWDMSMLEGHRRYNLGQTLLVAQTELTELHLDNLHLKDLPLWGKITEGLKKLSGTLEYLSLGGCFCGPTATLLGAHVFSCTCIKDCHRLKQFEMVICGMCVDSIEDLPCESLQMLNLGHMLIQDQIEYVARNMINLETWILPQRGCLINILVPKVSRYLFEAILHLPKLTDISLFSECSDRQEILRYVREHAGIERCIAHSCIAEAERNGDLDFHISRKAFVRDHSQLEEFMRKNRVNPVENLNRDDLVEFFIRNIIAGRVIEVDDFDEDVIWDEDEHEFIGFDIDNAFVL